MRNSSLSKPETWILPGIPMIFIAGTILHFLFDWLMGFQPVGVFSAVNESVWEHMKLAVWPTVLWWSLYLIFCGQKNQIDKNLWMTSAMLALITCLLAIPMLFYFYTGAFGVGIFWIDIIIFAVSVAAGQLIGLHYYRYGQGISIYISCGVIAITVIMFAVFTFFPPELPIFEDATNGTYGIAD